MSIWVYAKGDVFLRSLQHSCLEALGTPKTPEVLSLLKDGEVHVAQSGQEAGTADAGRTASEEGHARTVAGGKLGHVDAGVPDLGHLHRLKDLQGKYCSCPLQTASTGIWYQAVIWVRQCLCRRVTWKRKGVRSALLGIISFKNIYVSPNWLLNP